MGGPGLSLIHEARSSRTEHSAVPAWIVRPCGPGPTAKKPMTTRLRDGKQNNTKTQSATVEGKSGYCGDEERARTAPYWAGDCEVVGRVSQGARGGGSAGAGRRGTGVPAAA